MACSRGVVEHSVYTQRAEQGEALTPAQLATRRRGALFLNALVEMAALPCGSRTLQLVDLPQNWSGAPGAQSFHSDLVVVAAIVCICIKLHLALRKGGPRTLLDLLDMLLGELMRKAPEDVPAVHEGQVVKQEAFFLQQVGFEPAALAHGAHCKVGSNHHRLVGLASRLAATHVTTELISFASKVGMLQASHRPQIILTDCDL